MTTKTGTTGSDTIYGGGPDTLVGLAGNDTYVVYSQADAVVEQANEGTDTVYAFASYTLGSGVSVETLATAVNTDTAAINFVGNELGQTIVGNYGANILNGLGGNDTLIGLRGDDIYRIYALGDVVQEAAGEGNDSIYTSASYQLAAGVSVEFLSTADQAGTADLYLVGNEFAQRIAGNFGNNILNGVGGGDTLIGLKGDDIYRVYGNDDVVLEDPGNGNDTIYTSGSFTLTNGSSVETLSTAAQGETQAINLVGNEFAQRIIGNYGANIINGRGGGDTLIGLAGDDTYRVFDSGDIVVEQAGQGNDLIYTSASYRLAAGASVETLSTAVQGGTEAINLSGNEFANRIIGNYGDNILEGGAGSDTLIGLAGADTFRFASALGADNIDTIADYGNGADTILLDPSIFAAIAAGAVPGSAIALGSAAGDADDRLIYNPQTGALSYDPDGTGSAAATQFATLATGLTVAQLNVRVDAQYTATVSSPSIQEGNSGTQTLTFTVTLDRAAVSPFSLSYATLTGAGVTADNADYAPVTGTLAFAAGQTSATVPVSVFGDTTYEANETIRLQVSGGQLTAAATGTGTIVNDDTTVRIATSGTYSVGGATQGVALESAYPGATAFVFDGGQDQNVYQLAFGPGSYATGHPTIGFDNGFGFTSLDFSQLGTGLVATTGGVYRTAAGADIATLDPNGGSGTTGAFLNRPGTIAGTPFDDSIDLSYTRAGGDSTAANYGTIRAGAGNDTLIGGAVQDGGDGDDRLVAFYRASAGSFYGFGTQMTGGAGSDVFVIPDQARRTGTNSQANPNVLTDFAPGTDRIELVVRSGDGLSAGALDPSRFHVGSDATTTDQRIIYNADTGELRFDPNGSDADAAGAVQVFARLPAHLDLTAASFTIVVGA